MTRKNYGNQIRRSQSRWLADDPEEVAREALHMQWEADRNRQGGNGAESPKADETGNAPPPKPDSCFTLFDDIETSPRKKWIVQDFVGEGELDCDFGPPSSGKSVIVGDRNAHIAAGTPWFGRRVGQCAVVHVAAERAALVKRRYAAFKKHHGVSDLPLAVVSRRVDLCTNNAKLLLDYCFKLYS